MSQSDLWVWVCVALYNFCTHVGSRVPHYKDPWQCSSVTTATSPYQFLQWSGNSSDHLFDLVWALVVCSCRQTAPFFLVGKYMRIMLSLTSLSMASGSVVLSHLLPVVSDLCVVCLSLARGLSTLMIFFFLQSSSFLLPWLSLFFSYFQFHRLLLFTISFLLLCLLWGFCLFGFLFHISYSRNLEYGSGTFHQFYKTWYYQFPSLNHVSCTHIICDMLCFHFHLVLRIFAFRIPFTHVLFTSVWSHFYLSGGFRVVFLFLIPRLTPVWSRTHSTWVQLLQTSQVCNMAQEKFHLHKHPMNSKTVSCICWVVCSRNAIKSCWWQCCSVLLYPPDFLSRLSLIQVQHKGPGLLLWAVFPKTHWFSQPCRVLLVCFTYLVPVRCPLVPLVLPEMLAGLSPGLAAPWLSVERGWLIGPTLRGFSGLVLRVVGSHLAVAPGHLASLVTGEESHVHGGQRGYLAGPFAVQVLPGAQVSVCDKRYLRPSRDGIHRPWLLNAGGLLPISLVADARPPLVWSKEGRHPPKLPSVASSGVKTRQVWLAPPSAGNTGGRPLHGFSNAKVPEHVTCFFPPFRLLFCLLLYF